MRLGARVGCVLALAGVLLAGTPAAAVRPVERADSVRVVVQGRAGQMATAAAVRRAGGRVTRDLPIVRGVAADLPATALAALRRDPAVRAVTPDAEVRVAGVLPSDESRHTVRSVYRSEIGATALGATGAGVRIALVDTGVSEVADLAGRIVDVADPGGAPETLRPPVRCVDLSGEGDCIDRYGHGTFLAGLIAGNGAASSGRYAGVAPAAEIVSVKIAGRSGAADVSKVLAAIQWVVSFREQYGIRVLNLSLGTNSTAPYWIDPLNLAVENAWRAGIVVVVAAGNSGPRSGTVSKPGDDPWVITVGAVDDRGTTSLGDDRLPDFTSRGPTPVGVAKPDVVAPGARLVSLRLADSAIEEHAGGGSFEGTEFAAYRRGSGTSMSTAVTSGAVALLLQRHPDWTPDRVKFALTDSAVRVASRDARAIGAGLIRVDRADGAAPGLANGELAGTGTGNGSLDGSRGDVHVGSCDGTGECREIAGDGTAQDRVFADAEYASGLWTDRSWYTSQWATSMFETDWYGNSWLGNSWLGNSWLGNSWLGSSWYGDKSEKDDYGRPAPGGAWYGAWS